VLEILEIPKTMQKQEVIFSFSVYVYFM